LVIQLKHWRWSFNSNIGENWFVFNNIFNDLWT
jgi:hypothetical protein